MHLKKIKKKTILLFGKTRAFGEDEFKSQLKHHKITLTQDYYDEDIVLSVNGRMMSPYEVNASDELYTKKSFPSISIDELEKELMQEINEDALLMSLKLSHNKLRLKEFLQNSMISDNLFFKLLKLYSWSGEDFLENDENRDITSALISRFYKNIEKNHNVQYSTLGLMHLVNQSTNTKLIDTISSLEPLQKSFSSSKKDANFSIVGSIVKNEALSENTLKRIIKKSSIHIKIIIALRDNCSFDIQNIFIKEGDDDILFSLSCNANLHEEIIKMMVQNDEYSKNIAMYKTLNDTIFDIFFVKYKKELALNASLSFSMQKKLISCDDLEVKISLSSNENLNYKFINELLEYKNTDINFEIYKNKNTPLKILQQASKEKINALALSLNRSISGEILQHLYENIDKFEFLEALSKNENTPINILYQLQLDSKLERFVKENSAFGHHIQTENMGRLV